MVVPNSSMPNQEKVYAATKAAQVVFDLSSLNPILRESQSLEVGCSDSNLDHRIVALRHQLVPLMQSPPSDLFELDDFRVKLGRILKDSIWSQMDREKVFEFCEGFARNQLIRSMQADAIDSIKMKLTGVVATEALIDIGFALPEHVKKETPTQDFVLLVAVPLMTRLNSSPEQLSQACRVIMQEYTPLAKFFDS